MSLTKQAINHNRGTIVWREKRYDIPSLDDIGSMVQGDVCETPDGDCVEPDHPDSWLTLLGLS
jgi:hypothetical protein